MSKKLYQEILKLRLSQHIIHELIKRNKLKIFPHMAFGLEVMPVVLKEIFEKGDKLLLTHRNIAYNLVFANNNLKKILDELNLKKNGVSSGLMGSMNMENKKKGIIYTSSILGNNLSVSSGVALSSKFLSKKNSITYVITGDGAIEEGSFYETLLLAKYLKLRLVIIIENNNFSMATKINERRGPIDIKTLSQSLGISYQFINTPDVKKQYKNLTRIKKIVQKKAQPFVIETKVKMFNEHYGITQKNNFSNKHIDLTKGFFIKKNKNDPAFFSNCVLTKKISSDFIFYKSLSIKKYLKI